MILTNTSPQIFVGRDEVLGVLNKRLESLKSGYRQNVALTGQKLCGKTSILQQFLSGMKKDSVIPVYIEVMAEPFENFLNKFIGTMLFNFLKDYPGEAKDDLAFLIEKTQAFAPKTVGAIKEVFRLAEKGNPQEAYSALFDLTTVIKEETKKSCLIIMDEFHNLSCFNLKNPFGVFGKKIMIQKDTMYIVTSSQVSSIKRILKERLDLLFGNFEIIEIKDFDYSVSKAFLDKSLQGIEVPDELKDFIIAFTDGRPFYMDIIATRLSGIAAPMQAKLLGNNHISQALEDLLFDSKGTINQYFHNLLSTFADKPYENDYLDILCSIAEGRYRLSQISTAFKGKKKDMPVKVEKLIEENLISKNGFIYYFNDRVFEFWLKNVYNKKRHSMVSIFQDRSNMFKSQINELVSFFVEDNRKGIYERIEKLLGSFSNEVLKIDERSTKFPRFTGIKTDAPGAEEAQRLIKAFYSPGKAWVMQCRQQVVDEIAMAGIIDRFKKTTPASKKNILIALSGVEPNAMLIAKENKIWIWNKENLNFILSLYRRFKILF